MRSHCSLYVDAGYLLASAATRVTGTSLRNGIHVEYPKLVSALIEQAQQLSGLPVLRVHWYDSAKDGVPDTQQARIGELPRVKLRLGRFGVDGQQKGVDLRMGLDLVTHARNQASDVFLLVSGDDDLTEAVEEAQVHGVEVLILAVPNAAGRAHGVSRHLLRAADALAILDPQVVDASVMKVEVPPAVAAVVADPRIVRKPPIPTPNDLAAKVRPAPAAPDSVLAYTASTGGGGYGVSGSGDSQDYADQIDDVVRNVLASFRKSATNEVTAALLRGRPSIPGDIDRALLIDLSDELGEYDLSDAVRFRLRVRFWELFETA
ncbi:MAG: NYN domain-containing protein [Candidatus Nanopelagicales bacterium]